MSILDRVKNILLSPKTEWPTIAGEAATTQGLYTGYIMLLSAIGPLAVIVRYMAVGQAITTYVLGLVMVYVMALIVDALAPTFGGEKNFMQSLKLVAYSCTAVWLAGILQLLGLLGGLLALVALCYTLYTFYLGVTTMKKCPQEKAVAYTVVVFICTIVVAVVIGALMSMLGYGGMGY